LNFNIFELIHTTGLQETVIKAAEIPEGFKIRPSPSSQRLNHQSVPVPFTVSHTNHLVSQATLIYF
jgi:hypothetical protein